ncbi:MAG: TolC family protein [Lewinellaceae bacterium]|nr:TolC family protein [Lewinellaceae bacterium]
MPYDEKFEPAEEMTHPAADSLRWQSLVLEPQNTTEHLLLLNNLALNRIQTRSLWAQGLPNLSAYATGMFQTQRDDARVFDTDGRWYGAVAFGLQLDIPIFDGFRRIRKVRLLKLDAQKLEEDMRQVDEAKNARIYSGAGTIAKCPASPANTNGQRSAGPGDRRQTGASNTRKG